MSNAKLLDKQYRIPPDILTYIRTVLISNPNGEGVKRAKFILRNGRLTYQAMKRIKHDLETNINDKVQYGLTGGELMKSFIDRMLSSDRNAVKREREIKQPINVNLNTSIHSHSSMPELNEVANKDKKHNAIAIIVNGDNKILLLKRAIVEDGWGNGQWGLVGGGIEKKDKSPEAACRREVSQETGLALGKFIERFILEKNGNVEHLFVAKYDGDGLDIELNEENTHYGWFGIPEIKFLDTVPQLMEYIIIAFKDYK